MNRLLDFTGGKPDFNIDDMLWNDEATYEALNDVFRAFGDNYIIYGVTGTTPVTAGYVMLDGELLKVDAHAPSSTHFEKATTYDAGGDVTFNDGTPRQTWQKNRATITAGSGNLEYLDANRFEEILVGLVTGEHILRKVVDIGDWNMDLTNTVNVAHGIADFTKILGVTAVVRSDDDSKRYNLSYASYTTGAVNGYIGAFTSTNVTLGRVVSGFFDSTSYDSTSYNRGYMLIDYLP